MKKETIKKGNKTISIYELKVDARGLKDVLSDIQKSYPNKVITIRVEWVMPRYSKHPKNIRFDDILLEQSKQYQLKTGISFSDLVRLSLSSFLKRKLYDVDEW